MEKVIKICKECSLFIYKRSDFCCQKCQKRWKYKNDPDYREDRLKKSSQSVYKKRFKDQSKWVRLRDLTEDQVEKINRLREI